MFANTDFKMWHILKYFRLIHMLKEASIKFAMSVRPSLFLPVHLPF